jgi:hypothetical protein
MRVRAWLSTVFLFSCLAGSACSFKLGSMAHDQGKSTSGCEDSKYKMRMTSVEERRYVVYGCGEFQVFEGSCNGEKNGCERTALSAGCDGSCRVRRTHTGPLNEDGSIPEWALKGDLPPEE